LIAPERISRFLSYLLRHRPKEFPLAFDRHGFVACSEILDLVQERFLDATEQEVRAVVTESEKKRFELSDDRVRATYGHSFPVDLGLEPVQPPAELYYGTARDLAQSILHKGLKPRDRQFVHLSASLEDAEGWESGATRRRPSLSSIPAPRGKLTSLSTAQVPCFSPKTCRRSFSH
jgi:putative RNA 2'-phosphotransferase